MLYGSDGLLLVCPSARSVSRQPVVTRQIAGDAFFEAL